MAKTINKGYDVTNETSLITAAVGFDFASDFRTKENGVNEVKLVNTTSPIDRPETLRFAYSEIKDVYKNTDIDASVMAPSHKGVQILAQLNDVYTLTDDADASYRVDLPVSAHVVIKIPACEYITSSDVLGLVDRLNGSLFDSQTMDSNRLQALLRGVLEPSEL